MTNRRVTAAPAAGNVRSRSQLRQRMGRMATREDNQMFEEGRGYWREYLRLNGNRCRKPKAEGLDKLSRYLDLDKKYLLKRINVFLGW